MLTWMDRDTFQAGSSHGFCFHFLLQWNRVKEFASDAENRLVEHDIIVALQE